MEGGWDACAGAVLLGASGGLRHSPEEHLGTIPFLSLSQQAFEIRTSHCALSIKQHIEE